MIDMAMLDKHQTLLPPGPVATLITRNTECQVIQLVSTPSCAAYL